LKPKPIDSPLNYCIVIPTYNNAKTLKSVVDKVLEQNCPIIIVDDGSTDSTNQILASYGNYEIITHQINLGKGMALRNAFQKAVELGYEYAITIDSDGQHSPRDIPKLIEMATLNYGSVVMGCRDMAQEGIPKKSSFGNNFSNFWFWVETGIRLSDTQTGFRAYPLAAIKEIKWYTDRFEFEIEVIVRLAWNNIKFCEQAVEISYEDDRVSHFRTVKDFARISLVNAILVTLALLFFLPRLMLWNFSFAALWKQVKNEFVNNSKSPLQIAGSVALGLFFGIFPIWGFQMITAFAIASTLRLNRIIVLFCSNISMPPMTPLVIYFSFEFGGFFVAQRINFFDFDTINLSSIHLHLTQYLIGASLLAIAVSLVGFVITWCIAKIFGSI